ncbi:MAG: hypothetical protein A3I66_03130 [Burkholderiales bacterium RIFCSPLOWO2_02_FULL_57_36]|nr:MAG: hypothetical protein A3I66_03130 [Burkholderiales bacterium RIFCSPLOWO2_02_FULL_57_36]
MKAACLIALSGALLWSRLAAADAGFPSFADPHLAKGRAIWLDTCKACHAAGFADAPPVHDKEAWRPRLAKGKKVLQQHALNGFFGPQSTMMPPRGGNGKLSDDEVKAAVDYMIAIVK